ncbi:maturin isoform X1 [Dromaius novaehollandiae]|uniref:maturin isoform X1 n=1 Tax=Dromaius novaehollandiae TaxID=8790 RepID=UPI00311DF9F3
MAFEALAEAAERWCARTPFQLIAAEETERRMDFYAEPGVSFYVLCPDAACGDNFHVWSESEDCLPFLQLAQDYISSCGKKTLHEILEKVFKSFRPGWKFIQSELEEQRWQPPTCRLPLEIMEKRAKEGGPQTPPRSGLWFRS